MECARDAFGVVAEPVETSTRIFTPLAEAVAEIQRRREHTDLMQRVEDFLQGDIPEYLRSPAPVLYLARHVATPNLETLRFVELARGRVATVETGRYGADMKVTLVNDGPVTFWLQVKPPSREGMPAPPQSPQNG